MRIVSFILAVSVFAGCADYEEFDISSEYDLDRYLLEEMEIQNIPALSILIFRDTSVLYERYLGKSHLQQNIDLQSDHLFLLASLSKVITAIALLQLNEQGLFSLKDKINDYLPFQISVPGQHTDITFEMLLTHTSSIRDGSALDYQYYYGEDPPNSLEYFLNNYLVQDELYYNANENFYKFEPGTKYRYSNVGNALIALLVEQISKTNFNTYCKQHIFKPLGMAHSFWRLDEIGQNNAFIAQPYEYWRGKYEEIEHYTFTDYPNGGLRSNCNDLFSLLQAFVNEGRSNGHQLLNSETISQMLTLQIPSIDDEQGLQMYLVNKKYDLWGHDGGEVGVTTIMAFNPDNETGVIILTNEGNADLEEMLIQGYKFGLSR